MLVLFHRCKFKLFLHMCKFCLNIFDVQFYIPIFRNKNIKAAEEDVCSSAYSSPTPISGNGTQTR